MIVTALIFIALLALLVLVHEWGHFIAARIRGVEVEEFGFGFPPRIAGFRRGKTLYSLNLIPLGGFVKIRGESGDFSSDSNSFASKKPWEKSLILGAGVLMNLVCAFLLFSFGFMVGLPQQIDEHTATLPHVRDKKIIIADVESGSPAHAAGITAGDILLSLDGQQLVSTSAAYDYIASHQADEIAVTVNRADGDKIFTATPAQYGSHDSALLGIAMIQTGVVAMNPAEAVARGAQATATTVVTVILALGALVYNLFAGHGVGDQLSGPLGVAVVTGQVARLGLPYLISFAAMLSVNLGILNVLPIPALDGGRLAFVLIEKLRGAPLNQRIETLLHKIGFSLLILLIIFVTFKDVGRYGKPLWDSLSRLLS